MIIFCNFFYKNVLINQLNSAVLKIKFMQIMWLKLYFIFDKKFVIKLKRFYINYALIFNFINDIKNKTIFKISFIKN